MRKTLSAAAAVAASALLLAACSTAPKYEGPTATFGEAGEATAPGTALKFAEPAWVATEGGDPIGVSVVAIEKGDKSILKNTKNKEDFPEDGLFQVVIQYNGGKNKVDEKKLPSVAVYPVDNSGEFAQWIGGQLSVSNTPSFELCQLDLPGYDEKTNTWYECYVATVPSGTTVTSALYDGMDWNDQSPAADNTFIDSPITWGK